LIYPFFSACLSNAHRHSGMLNPAEIRGDAHGSVALILPPLLCMSLEYFIPTLKTKVRDKSEAASQGTVALTYSPFSIFSTFVLLSFLFYILYIFHFFPKFFPFFSLNTFDISISACLSNITGPEIKSTQHSQGFAFLSPPLSPGSQSMRKQCWRKIGFLPIRTGERPVS
jgi:hypothetical protein